jgi:hypothetical protein
MILAPQDRKVEVGVSPDKGQRRRAAQPKKVPQVRLAPTDDDPFDVVFFRRHADDDPATPMPGREFLNSCPTKVKTTMRNVLVAVATAPPKKFAGGGYWEAMKGDLTGHHEVRVDGPGREHFRLFCVLDTSAAGRRRGLLTVLWGARKPFRTEFDDSVYRQVKAYSDEYFKRPRRSIG